MRVVSWNVQACRIRSPEADPVPSKSYDKTDLTYIANKLLELEADVIFLQEIHANEESDQASQIAQQIGLKHVITDTIDDVSFIDGDYRFCQSVISRIPFSNHEYLALDYPPYEAEYKGRMYTSRDSGISKVVIEVDGRVIELVTTHMLPFGTFKIDPFGDESEPIRRALTDYLQGLGDTWILGGDINVNTPDIHNFLPDVFDNPEIKSIPLPSATSAWGDQLDHFVYKGIQVANLKIDSSTLTDHFPVIVDFEL